MTNEAADILRKAKELSAKHGLVESVKIACPTNRGLRLDCIGYLADADGALALSPQEKRSAFDRAIALAEAGNNA